MQNPLRLSHEEISRLPSSRIVELVQQLSEQEYYSEDYLNSALHERYEALFEHNLRSRR